MSKNNNTWFYRTGVVYVLLIIFFPIGYICLWNSPKFSEEKKWIVSFILPFIVVGSFYLNEENGMGKLIFDKKDTIEKELNPQSKMWGNIKVSLKETKFNNKTVVVKLILKNLGDQDDNFNSLFQTEMISNSNKGNLDIGNSNCDGTMHPGTIIRCKLTFNFTNRVNKASIKIGAGIFSDAIFFKLSNYN